MYKYLIYVLVIIANNYAMGMELPEDHTLASIDFDLEILPHPHEDCYPIVTNPAPSFNLNPAPSLLVNYEYNKSHGITYRYTNYYQQTGLLLSNQSQTQHAAPTVKNELIKIKPYLHTNSKSNETAMPTPPKIITKKPVSIAETLLRNIMLDRYRKIDTQCCGRAIKSVSDMTSHIHSHHNFRASPSAHDIFQCSNPQCKNCPYGAIEGAKCHFLMTHYPDMYKCPRKNCKTLLSAYSSLRLHYLQKCTCPLPDGSTAVTQSTPDK